MKILMINILSVIFFTLTARTQVLAVNSDSIEFKKLNGLCKTCDSLFVFTAMLKSKTGQHLFSESRYKNYYSPAVNRLMFSNDKERNSFDDLIFSDFEHLTAAEKNQIICVAISWCNNNRLTDSILNKYGAYLEQVLYEIPKAKNLFKKYIVNKRQSWESLSFWQVEDLFQNYLDFLYSLTKEDRQVFFTEFAKTAKRLGPPK